MRIDRQFDRATARDRRAVVWFTASTRRSTTFLMGAGRTPQRARVNLARQVREAHRPQVVGRRFWREYAQEHPESVVTVRNDGTVTITRRDPQ